MYKIAVCDDEQEYRKTVISEILDLDMVTAPIEFYQFKSGEELLNSDMDFDLLFLDIQMPGRDGNEVSAIFRRYNKKCILIFCTSYQMPLRENFKVYPFRYIMKDLRNKELKEELPDILAEMMDKAKKCYISVTRDGELARLPINHIMYVTVEGRKTKIVCYDSDKSCSVYCREKLKELYEEAEARMF
ncbi:MAG: LytTR family DNA-binding domain-containing protein [Muricomes sp.]